MRQPKMMTMEISTAREQQLFNGKNFHVVIYNKTESASGLHQHDYYEFTIVLTGRYYQEINGKRVLLERGDFVFIPMGSHHQSFYEFGATRILNVGISKRFFEKHYLPLLPFGLVASQVYAVKKRFSRLHRVGYRLAELRETEFDEFIELVSFYTINRLRHYREEPAQDVIPQWLKNTVELCTIS
jgi:AraC family cel operon transcriptional repressor